MTINGLASTVLVGALGLLAVSSACTSGSSGIDAGTNGLGANGSVPQTCQMCLAQSSSNECSSQQKTCANDATCTALNACINRCANINSACIASCGNAASQNAITEWNAWSQCDCGTCASQCNQTFCGIGGDAGNDASTDGGACIVDNQPCSTTEPCCTFCPSDNVCGCVPPTYACTFNSDCCSGNCDTSGVCQ